MKMKAMNGVRLLLGTRKGALVLTSDGKRERVLIEQYEDEHVSKMAE
jgi:hypothetical protein